MAFKISHETGHDGLKERDTRHLVLFISMQLMFTIGQQTLLYAGDTKNVSTISVNHAKQLLNSPDTVVIDVRKHRNWWRTSKKILSAVRENPTKIDQWAGKYSQEQTLIFY